MDERKSDRLTNPGQSVTDTGRRPGNRRRGETLETAILQAAWDELADFGYAHVTMEGVAARAKTNKAVLYRRWPNKAKLVSEAIRKYLPRPSYEVPDTGDLRTDVFRFLQGIAQPMQTIGTQTLRGLMIELLDRDFIAAIPQTVHPATEGRMTTAMLTMLKNAEARGEVSLEKISARIISLPLDLFRFELLTTFEPISDQAIHEIVDDIFMPLVQA